MTATLPEPAQPPVSQATTALRPLEPAHPVESSLAGGQTDSYTLSLAAREYVHLVVEQHGIDVVVALFDPQGTKLAEVDSPNGSQGPEPLRLVTEIAGDYRLEVRSLEKEAPAGRYEARIVEIRTAVPQDADRMAAARSFAAGEVLRGQATADSLQKALIPYEAALARFRAIDDAAGQAQVLDSIGTTYGELRNHPKALEAHNRALVLKQAVKDRKGEAESLNNIGSAYDAMDDKSKALEFYTRALSFFRAEQYAYGEAITLSNLGGVYSYRREKDKALESFNQALPIFRRIGDRRGEATALNDLGALYFSVNEYALALEHFHQALPLIRAVKDRRGEGYTLSNIGLIYDTQGDKTRALATYQQALPILQQIGDRYGQGTVLNNIGLLYSSLGEKQKALDSYEEGLRLERALRDRDGEASILNGIGAVYASIGENRKALDRLMQALPLRRAIQDKAGEAATLNNIGRIQSDLGNLQAARGYHLRALALWRAAGDRDGQAVALNNLGTAARSGHAPREALAYFERSLELYRAIGSRSGIANTLTNAGATYRMLGEIEKATACLAEALPLRRAVDDHQGESTTLLEWARVDRARGDLGAARTHLEEAVRITETLRTKLASEAYRASYLATVRDQYETYIDVLMQLNEQAPAAGHSARALQASELARARSLLDLLSQARVDIREGVDPALLERERDLQRRLSARADRQTRLLSETATAGQAAALAKEIDALSRDLEETVARIRATSPRYAALTDPSPLSLREIQERVLDDDTLLLEYSLGEERSYLWVASSRTLSSFTLPRRADLTAAARTFYERLTERNRRSPQETAGQRALRIQRADGALAASAASLSRMLLQPASALLGNHRLLIVADSSLQYIPFSALPAPATSLPSSARHPPLVVDHEVIHVASASMLAVLRRELAGRAVAPRAVAVLADPVFSASDPRVKMAAAAGNSRTRATRPVSRVTTVRALGELERSAVDSGVTTAGGGIPRLPFTRREADNIVRNIPAGDALRAVDFAASRSQAMRADLGLYRVVHFATHGLLNNQHPELSGIVLSLVNERGEPEDGFLRLHDIYNLELPVELVVLSACQTALGKEVRGEGLVGLTRGFMYAGAPRVLASLWKVDDAATSELMKRFYAGLFGARHLSPPAALREAQVSLWREGRWTSPYFWAAFSLQGEWR